MAKKTGIAWVQNPETGERGQTWNPVTGCDRISAGCENCYALSLAPQLKAMGAKRYQNDGDPRTSGPGFGVTVHPDLLQSPLARKKPTTYFVNSMSDLFHAKVPLEFVQRVFEVIEATPQHTYQVLTKRAARLPKVADKLPWPSNLWMGVTIENADALWRADALRAVPAAVRFISAEPLIGPLVNAAGPTLELDGIAQVITGGESGPNHRPIEAQWVRDIRDVCVSNDVAFFHKQWGGLRPKSGGNELDGVVWEQVPARVAASA